MAKRSMTSHEILDYWRMQGNVMWEGLRQQYGLPIPIPRPDREEVDNDFRDDFAGASEGELPELLDGYRDAVESKVRSLARFYLAIMRRAGRSRTQERTTRTRRDEHRNVYQEFSDERYIRILAFVSQREVPFRNLLERSFSTAGRRISWDRVAAEWSGANPRDRLNARSLKRYYYRARYQKRLRDAYFDRLFKQWAAGTAPDLAPLKAAGYRDEDLFVRSEDRFVSDGVLDDLKQLADRYASHPDYGDRFRALYESFNRHRNAEAWVTSAKLPPFEAAALQRAVSRKRKCGLTADFVAWPRETRFCEGPHCRRCKVGADLVRTGFARQEDLVELAAAGAGERHRRRLDESAQNLRKILDFVSGRSRRS